MNKIALSFKAANQKLTAVGGSKLFTSNTVSYITAHFELGENWTGFDSVRAEWFTDFDCIGTVLDGNGDCVVPHEVLTKLATVKVNLVGSNVINDVLTDRLTTEPCPALIIDKLARIDGSETAEVTPNQFEQYIAIVGELVHSVKDITNIVLNPDYTLTINYSDGTSDTTASIRGEQGPPGPTGNGIANVEKIGTSGLVDTYRINYTNGQHYDFTVTNGEKGDTGPAGNGIDHIALTNTAGAVKTYTIYFTDGTEFDYYVTDGEVTVAMLDPFMITDTASGAIASFPDGQNVYPLKSLTAEINPIQDLHGYDSPWVGGGGKNKLPFDLATIKSINTSGTWNDNTYTHNDIAFKVNADGTITLNGTASAEAYISITSNAGIGAGDYTISGADGGSGTTYLIQSKIDGAFKNTYASNTYTVSTGITTVIVDVKNGVTLNNVTVKPMIRLSTVADGTYAPYSNICPISGWNSVGVVDCGKNLFDKTNYGVINAYISGTTFVVASPMRSVYIPCKPNTTYTAVNDSGNNRKTIFYTEEEPTNGGSVTATSTGTITTSANAKFIGVYCYNGNVDTVTFQNVLDALQIELGTTATTYESYNGTTKTVTLPTTTYGGSVDLVSGVLTIDRVKETYEWANGIDASVLGNNTRKVFKVANASVRQTAGKPQMCSCAPYLANYADDTTHFYVDVGSAGSYSCVVFLPNSITSQAFEVEYELATPQTVQLTAETINTLKGTNNIFSSANGDVTVEYIADTKLYIAKQ